MSHDLANVYIGQLMAKQVMHEAMYGKPKAKKKSFIKKMMKKISK